jgi:hypothetical protein
MPATAEHLSRQQKSNCQKCQSHLIPKMFSLRFLCFYILIFFCLCFHILTFWYSFIFVFVILLLFCHFILLLSEFFLLLYYVFHVSIFLFGLHFRCLYACPFFLFSLLCIWCPCFFSIDLFLTFGTTWAYAPTWARDEHSGPNVWEKKINRKNILIGNTFLIGW